MMISSKTDEKDTMMSLDVLNTNIDSMLKHLKQELSEANKEKKSIKEAEEVQFTPFNLVFSNSENLEEADESLKVTLESSAATFQSAHTAIQAIKPLKQKLEVLINTRAYFSLKNFTQKDFGNLSLEAFSKGLSDTIQNVSSNWNSLQSLTIFDQFIETVNKKILLETSKCSKAIQQKLKLIGWPICTSNSGQLRRTLNDPSDPGLQQLVESFKCFDQIESIRLMVAELTPVKSTTQDAKIGPFVPGIVLRFRFHFSNKRPTNNISHPEYFFQYFLTNIYPHVEFIPKFSNLLQSDEISKERFLNQVLEESIHWKFDINLKKVLRSNDVITFSKYIDETIRFDKKLDAERSISVLSRIYDTEDYFCAWITFDLALVLDYLRENLESSLSSCFEVILKCWERFRFLPANKGLSLIVHVVLISLRFASLRIFSNKSKSSLPDDLIDQYAANLTKLETWRLNILNSLKMSSEAIRVQSWIQVTLLDDEVFGEESIREELKSSRKSLLHKILKDIPEINSISSSVMKNLEFNSMDIDLFQDENNFIDSKIDSLSERISFSALDILKNLSKETISRIRSSFASRSEQNIDLFSPLAEKSLKHCLGSVKAKVSPDVFCKIKVKLAQKLERFVLEDVVEGTKMSRSGSIQIRSSIDRVLQENELWWDELPKLREALKILSLEPEQMQSLRSFLETETAGSDEANAMKTLDEGFGVTLTTPFEALLLCLQMSSDT